MQALLQRLMGRLAQIAPGGYGLRPCLQRWRGVHIGKRVWISQMVYLDELYPEAIRIGDNSTIGMRSSVFTHFHWGSRRNSGGYKAVVIEPNVFVGPHCVILPGVNIGEGAVIKAGSVVSRNIPARVFWGGTEGRPLAAITVPLTPDSSYEEFVRGLKPLRSAATPISPEQSESGGP
jgi:acetyltransferase-like isoleucine patch superfamily enzyme